MRKIIVVQLTLNSSSCTRIYTNTSIYHVGFCQRVRVNMIAFELTLGIPLFRIGTTVVVSNAPCYYFHSSSRHADRCYLLFVNKKEE